MQNEAVYFLLLQVQGLINSQKIIFWQMYDWSYWEQRSEIKKLSFCKKFLFCKSEVKVKI